MPSILENVPFRVLQTGVALSFFKNGPITPNEILTRLEGAKRLPITTTVSEIETILEAAYSLGDIDRIGNHSPFAYSFLPYLDDFKKTTFPDCSILYFKSQEGLAQWKIRGQIQIQQ